MDSDLKTIGIILIVSALATFGYAWLQDPSHPPIITPSHTVVCDVTLENWPFFPVNIKNYDCYTTKKCYLEPFFFEDRGNLEVTIGTRTARTNYVIGEGGTKTYSLSKCIPDGRHNAYIRLFENNVVIDSEEFTMEVN